MNIIEQQKKEFDEKFINGFCDNCHNTNCKNHATKSIKSFLESSMELAKEEGRSETLKEIRETAEGLKEKECLKGHTGRPAQYCDACCEKGMVNFALDALINKLPK